MSRTSVTASAPQLAEQPVEAGAGPHRRSAVRAAAGRRGGAATTRPRATRSSSVSGAVDGVERPELGHRPAVDGDDDALARPGPPHGRGRVGPQVPDADPIHRRQLVTVCTRVYTRPTGRPAPAARRRLGAMNFAFTEEQEELRKTVRSFLEQQVARDRGPSS